MHPPATVADANVGKRLHPINAAHGQPRQTVSFQACTKKCADLRLGPKNRNATAPTTPHKRTNKKGNNRCWARLIHRHFVLALCAYLTGGTNIFIASTWCLYVAMIYCFLRSCLCAEGNAWSQGLGEIITGRANKKKFLRLRMFPHGSGPTRTIDYKQMVF